MKELNQKLRQLQIEDNIWIVYLIIILLSWYSNGLERDYYINGNWISLRKYRKIIIIIFMMLNVVYTYFYIDSWKGISNLKSNDNNKKKDLTYLSYIASTLISISGIILLIIAIVDTENEIEIAFN